MQSTPPRRKPPLEPLPIRPVRLLARQTGIHFTMISMLMNGRRRLTVDSAQALAKAYHLPLEELIARLKVTVTRNQARAEKRPRRTSTTKEKKER